MTRDADARLREGFAALRREESRRAPGFDATLVAVRSGRPGARGSHAPWLMVAAAAGVAALWVVSVLPGPNAPDDFSLSWTTATDVLLATPGSDLLRSPGWDPALRTPEPTEIGPTSRLRGRIHG